MLAVAVVVVVVVAAAAVLVGTAVVGAGVWRPPRTKLESPHFEEGTSTLAPASVPGPGALT